MFLSANFQNHAQVHHNITMKAYHKLKPSQNKKAANPAQLQKQNAGSLSQDESEAPNSKDKAIKRKKPQQNIVRLYVQYFAVLYIITNQFVLFAPQK
jgi:hypothetical protein